MSMMSYTLNPHSSSLLLTCRLRGAARTCKGYGITMHATRSVRSTSKPILSSRKGSLNASASSVAVSTTWTSLTATRGAAERGSRNTMQGGAKRPGRKG